jgi:cytochrome c553
MAIGLAGAVSAQSGRVISFEEASVLAGGCVNCHGPDGAGMPPVPPIAGLPEDGFIARMTEFRADLVPGATIMQRIALGFDDAEIAALARYFGGGWTGATP